MIILREEARIGKVQIATDFENVVQAVEHAFQDLRSGNYDRLDEIDAPDLAQLVFKDRKITTRHTHGFYKIWDFDLFNFPPTSSSRPNSPMLIGQIKIRTFHKKNSPQRSDSIYVQEIVLNGTTLRTQETGGET